MEGNEQFSRRDVPESIVPRASLPGEDQDIALSEQGSTTAAMQAAGGNRQYVLTHSPEIRMLLSWVAPNRPYRKRGKEYFVNVAIILIAIEVILFLFHQYMLMVLAFSVVFLAFTLALVPPHPFHYKISTQGITIEDHYFLWQELYDFYFKKQDGVDVLIVSTKSYLPGELTIVLGQLQPDRVKNILLPYLPFREFVKPSFIERASEWINKTFPLEKRPVQVAQQPQ